MTDVGVLGAAGRMGRAVCEAARERTDIRLGALIDPALGTALDACGPPPDVFVDFSTAAAAEKNAAYCAHRGIPLVCAVTGGDTEARRHALLQAAEQIPVLESANLLRSAALMRALARTAATALLPQWQAVIVERHHAGKKDAPSGTACLLADAVDMPRKDVFSVRAGTIAGTHEVSFYGTHESLTLLHEVCSREAFAWAALSASVWLTGCAPGLYTMEDVF